MLTQQRLKELVVYNPETGLFTWKESTPPGKSGPKHFAGQPVKRSFDSFGHVQLFLDGKKHLSARLAWLYMTGEWPSNYMDHANRTPSDDRWENLRQATAAQNSTNRKLPSNNTSGCRGVQWQAGKWYARITANGVVYNLGAFSEYEDAVRAREAAAVRLHAQFVQLDSATSAASNL